MAISWSYKKREEIADENGRQCAHCGAERLVSKRDAENGDVIYIIDHIIPQVDGGSDEINNLQLLCQPCNLSKNGRSDFDEHYIRKQEVDNMRTELAELTGLEDVYMERMLQSFSYKDRHHLLTKLLNKEEAE